jgi:hypothetical protein
MAEKTKQENRVCFSVLKNALVFGALRENGLFSRALLSNPVKILSLSLNRPHHC